MAIAWPMPDPLCRKNGKLRNKRNDSDFVLYEQMPKEISEIRGHRPRLQLVAGIVDAGFCDSFRKFLMRTALDYGCSSDGASA